MGKAINELDNAGSITDATLVPVGETNTLKKTTWATIKSTLKTYFDSLYLAVTGGTITDTTSAVGGASAGSALTVNQTWNTTGTPTAIKLNVTDTASNAASLLMDLQVGGASKFRVEKSGYIRSTLTAYESIGWVVSGNQYGGLHFGANGNVRWSVSDGNVASNGVAISAQWGGYFEINADNGTSNIVRLYRDAANTLAQRNGTNAQTFRLYNTYTDSSNYERGFMRWNSNVLEIGTEKAGTGSTRFIDVYIGTTRQAHYETDISVNRGYSGVSSTGTDSGNRFYFNAVEDAVCRLASRVGASPGAAMQFVEMTAPAAPAADGVRIYAEDDGAGKTRLMALFATGAAVQIAIEP